MVRICWHRIAVALLWALGSATAAPPEYLANEQVAPEDAGGLRTPLDGFTEGMPELAPGIFGDTVGERLPFLEGLFGEATLELAPRSYYLYSSIDGRVREEAAFGGRATLTTGWLNEFVRFGFSGYTSQALYTPDDRGGTGLLQADGESYWSPGEAYLEAKVDDLFAFKGFRQELNLPYFNRNDSRMTPRVHEAYSLISDAIPNLRIGAIHIDKIKDRVDGDFRSLSESAGAIGTDRGATLAGLRYHWRDGASNLGALNAYGWDTFNTLYAESTHRFELSNDFELSTSFQGTHQTSVGDELLGELETYSIGGQAALSYAGLVATAAYTTTDEGAGIRSPWGGKPAYNSVMISDFDRAGEDAWRIGLSYPLDRIGLPGVSAFANYVQGDTPEYGPAESPDQEEFDLTVDFRPEKGVFKNFWLRVRHGWNDGLADANHRNFRVILNYSKQF